ncbi:MAG: hypothetical protein OEP95_08750 [Myxococcales bacterium]|nr:hypothetical protein [Myxococcales bacterium]
MSALQPTLPETARAEPGGDDCRCLCGSLLARLVEGGVELKCRRCKRTMLIPLESSQTTEARGEPPRALPAAPARAPVRAAPRGREGQPCLGRPSPSGS